jgi:hypothetical protein
MSRVKSQFRNSCAFVAIILCVELLSACIPAQPIKSKEGKDLGCLPKEQLKEMEKNMDQSKSIGEHAKGFGIGHLGNLVMGGLGDVAALGYESDLTVDKLRKQKQALRFIDYHACAPGEEPATLPTTENENFADSINVFKGR